MPPRFVYWTIVIDGTPTAFRASLREELLPTLRQIQRKTPSAVMKWFARGRVWESPAEAKAAYHATGARRRKGPAGPWRQGRGGRRDRNAPKRGRDR